MKKWVSLLVCAAALTACNGTTDSPTSPGISSASMPSLTAIFHRDPIYFGLKKTSYGSLSVYQDTETHNPVTPPPCDPDAKYSDVNELSRQITAMIVSPLQSSFKADDPIAQEELQHNFKIFSDPSGNPPVAILDRSSKGIVFWHESELVTLPEVNTAAKEFCSRKKKVALYEGSARKCSEPKIMPVIVNGKTTHIETYVISSFQCS